MQNHLSPALPITLIYLVICASGCDSNGDAPASDVGDVEVSSDVPEDSDGDGCLGEVPDALDDQPDSVDRDVDSDDADENSDDADEDSTDPSDDGDQAGDFPPADLADPDGFELPPSIETIIELTLAEASLVGDTPSLLDDRGSSFVMLSADGTVAWDFETPASGAALLEIDAAFWRQESAQLSVTTGETAAVTLFQGSATPRWLSLFNPLEQPHDRLAGVDFAPRPFHVELSPGLNQLEVSLDDPQGHLMLYGARLVPLRDEVLRPLEGEEAEPYEPGGEVVLVAPCDTVECDDAVNIAQALAAHPERVIVELEAATYTFHSPLVIRRSGVTLRGAGQDATFIVWNPVSTVGDWQRAITFTGSGPQGGYIGLLEPVTAETRALVMPDEAPFEVGMTLHLVSDDIGEIPPLCIDGRDGEHQLRHVNWIAEVLEVEETDSGKVLWMDRHLGYSLPLEAHPRVSRVELADEVALTDVAMQANCPEAEDLPPLTLLQAECANPAVVGHSALAFIWARGGHAENVTTRWFGRFGIEVTQSLGTRIVGGRTTLPSDYGDGGKGYGVHVIRSGRTLVQGYEVEQARHGVVVDFGSTETQVIGCSLSTCSLAAVDVHGEASHDTLVLGNEISGSAQGVIVGGGGREEHCNDGPRHHIVSNHLDSNTLAGIWLTDYSSQVTAQHNTIEGSISAIYADAGTTDVRIYRNHLRDSMTAHVWVRQPEHGTGPIRLVDNLMDGEPPGFLADSGIELTDEGSWFEE